MQHHLSATCESPHLEQDLWPLMMSLVMAVLTLVSQQLDPPDLLQPSLFCPSLSLFWAPLQVVVRSFENFLATSQSPDPESRTSFSETGSIM